MTEILQNADKMAFQPENPKTPGFAPKTSQTPQSRELATLTRP
ncbi:hypothetical Protein YC6258_04879 [Gynuella sunshinyii YC6258]|uniref:Uncharacterized protein n=1 Tax=Gynuella sunshinyii YC6258 TaxID=1445510 RepID=A0A0C5VRP8_9GAMM|nr:hypothetical Protein YC6258_04879 [Gynuella sunshinyii YC6258]